MISEHDRSLVFGIYRNNNEIVFIPRRDAEALAAVRQALAAPTWGDFKQAAPDRHYRELVELYRHATEPPRGTEPPPTDAFPGQDLPWVADGDWPPFPATQMLDWVPAGIQQQFGRIEHDRLGHEWLAFDAQDEAALVAAFAENGYNLSRDDTLIRKATGMT